MTHPTCQSWMCQRDTLPKRHRFYTYIGPQSVRTVSGVLTRKSQTYFVQVSQKGKQPNPSISNLSFWEKYHSLLPIYPNEIPHRKDIFTHGSNRANLRIAILRFIMYQ